MPALKFMSDRAESTENRLCAADQHQPVDHRLCAQFNPRLQNWPTKIVFCQCLQEIFSNTIQRINICSWTVTLFGCVSQFSDWPWKQCKLIFGWSWGGRELRGLGAGGYLPLWSLTWNSGAYQCSYLALPLPPQHKTFLSPWTVMQSWKHGLTLLLC